MTDLFFTYGEPSDFSSDYLVCDVAKRMLSVLLTQKSDFEILELRRLSGDDDTVSDIIVVECINDQVPTLNPFGIKVRERLALVFTPQRQPEVRSLRKDFPKVLHRNHVMPNEPSSICLYFEPWSVIARNWTPQNFLQRILWWLRETAKGTLHRPGQPLEQIYYDSPYKIVLPPDFNEKIADESLSLILGGVQQTNGGFKIIRGAFHPKVEMKKHNLAQTEIISLNLPAIMHGPIEMPPNMLGEVHEQLESRGAPFLEKLIALIRAKTPAQGLERNPQIRCLLIFTIPVKRTMDADPETHEIRAFHITTDLTVLGETTGALTLHDKKFYAIELLGDKQHETSAWREIPVSPIDVRFEADADFARKASAVESETAQFRGVLAGVGALGSAMAGLWSKESWGEWAYVDHDTVEPHNIVRHIATNDFIGEFKVDAVNIIVKANYHSGYYKAVAIPDTVLNRENARVEQAVTEADLLVDVTTTDEVLREWSFRSDLSRSTSVFVTPSGNNSVLFIENADRTIRLDCLEAQYYRAIINSQWGANILVGNLGTLWVGAGCRDVSGVISNEMIQLHASILARQVRLLRDHPGPCIKIWNADPVAGTVGCQDIEVEDSLRCEIAGWHVVWDNGVKRKLSEVRRAHLPKETGGVILGYNDQKLRVIYVVDVLPAPPDSQSCPTEFIRGFEGLEDTLNEISRRTAGVVGYIGEWHSHPAFTSAYPSQTDWALIENLSCTLALDGQPALMVIVGTTGSISLSVRMSDVNQ